MAGHRSAYLFAGAVALAGCTSVLPPAAAPDATTTARGRCTIVVTRPGGDWARWDEQLCDAAGRTPDGSRPWFAALVTRAVDDAELAECGAPRCGAHHRAVRFYVVTSPAVALTSQADDERIAVVVSSALVDRVGRDAGFYELAFAHELAHVRLGATCGEGAQSDDVLRDLACDREALRWLDTEHPGDAAWTGRAKILAEARAR